MSKVDNREHSVGQDHFDDLIARNIPAGEKEVMEREASRGAAQDIAEREGLAGAGSSGRNSAAAGRGELSNRESSGSSDSGGDDTNSGGGGFRKGLQKIKEHRKQAIVSLILGGGLLGGGFGLFSIGSGPFQAIMGMKMLSGNHNGPLEDFSDDRSAKFMLYALAGQAAQGRLGFIRNHNADKWEKRLNDSGLKSVYSPTTQRLIGYQIINEDRARQYVADMEKNGHTRQSTVDGVDYKGSRDNIRPADGPFLIAQRGDYKAVRAMTRSATKSVGTNNISAWMAYRLQTKRGGVNWHPIERDRWLADALGSRKERIDAEREARKKNMEDGVNGGGSSSSDRQNRNSIKDRFNRLMRIARGPLLLIVAACGFHSFSESIDAQNLDNQLLMMRMAGEKLAVGSQVMANKDISLEQLGVFVDDYYDEETKTSWTQDNGMRYENGEEMNGYDLIEESKPSREPKPWYFQVVDNSFVSAILTPICATVEAAGEAINSIPLVAQANDALGAIVDWVIKGITDKTPAEWIKVAIDYFATEGVDVLAEGAKRGGYDNVGMALLAKNQFEAMGGTDLTPAEGAAVKQAALQESNYEFAHASIFDRYFNPYETRSALAKVAMAAPKNRTQFMASIQRLPVNIGNSMMRTFGMHKAFAAAAPTYDYGFNMSGFSLAEIENPAYEDIVANENYILEGDRLERMNQEYGEPCFFMTITRDGGLQYGETGNMLTTPAECDDKNNIELTRYRFYKADLVVGHTMACLEGDEESCTQIGMGATQAAGTPPPTGSAPTGNYINPLDGSNYRCTSGFGPRWGTQHAGVDMALPVGNRVLAPTSGTVKRAGASSGYGLAVVILGDDGFYYELGHVDSVSVKEGDIVKAGDEVAKSGNTGQSTGPHLHFGVATGFFTGRIDPEKHMGDRGIILCLQ